jgi:hypothetical protein
VTAVDGARRMQARVAGAQCAGLPASRLDSVEAEAAFTRPLRRFLE